MLKINENQNDIIAYICDKKNKIQSVINYKCDNGLDNITIKDDYHFQIAPIPISETERITMFVAGESGSGKSYFIREYAKFYHKIFPNNPIYLISNLDSDETIDEYKKIIRLNACNNPEFLSEISKIDINEWTNSFIIFDDIDSITNKNKKEIIYGFLNKCLRIGRHNNISVAYLGHELYGLDVKHVLNECKYITFFPKYLNHKRMKYLLETYFGMSKNQIQLIKEIGLNTRPITYVKGYPKYIIADHIITSLNDI